MGSRIPDLSRELVARRDGGRCVRCLTPGGEWHHRRSRSVRDAHQHCPCVGVTLCGHGNLDGCHGWVHARALQSRPLGLVVPRHVTEPYTVPFRIGGSLSDEWLLPMCDGTAHYVEAVDMDAALALFAEQGLVQLSQ